VTKSVSVIVPTFARPDDLGRCLRGLGRQTRPADEIVVVVRPEDEASIVLCSHLAGALPIRVVHVHRPGQVAALNAGRDAARGSILAITDDDVEPTTDWLKKIEHHFRDPRVGAVGGRDIVHNGNGPVESTPVARVGAVRLVDTTIPRGPRTSPS
jgi:glycosyltransferase involved in cell wall biosynthesis